MAVAVVDVQVKSANAVSQLRQINTASTQAQGAIRGLAKAAAGLALVEFGRRSVQAAASINDLNTRLKLLTSEYGEFEQAQRLASESAKTFGLSTREATAGIADIYARLRPLGISLDQISSTYQGFNVIARLSGVSAEGASAAFTQLAQALGSGALRGDEFNSISEQVPGLLTAISQETGIAQGKLRDYAAQGKITSQVVLSALKRVEKEGGAKIKKLIEQSDIQKFKELQNATEELSAAFGQTLLPAVTPIVRLLTDLTKAVGQLPAPVRTAAVAVGLLALAVKTLNGAVAISLIQRLGTALAGLAGVTNTVTIGYTVAGAAITKTNLVITASTIAVGALKAALLALPWVAVAAGVTFFVSKIIEANNKQKELNETIKSGSREALEAALSATVLAQAQAQQRVQNLKNQRKVTGAAMRSAKADLELQNDNIRRIQDRLGLLAEEADVQQQNSQIISDQTDKTKQRKDISERQLQLEAKLLEAQNRKDVVEQAYLEKLIQREQILSQEMEPRRQMLELIKAEFEYSQKIKDIRKEIADIMASAKITTGESTFDGSEAGGIFTADDGRTKHLEELKTKLEELMKPLEQMKRVSETIGEAFSRGIRGMVEGTVTAQQALANFFRSVADSFMDMAAEIIKAAIRMMAFNVISSMFGGAPKFAASSMTAPGLAGSLKTPVSGFALGGPQALGKLASGGTATGGRSYLVGEKGPELFTPGRTGSVAPSGSFGGVGNITVNVDASGSNVEGNADQANQLGKVIGLAVQQELVKQKRPGGLLA